MREMVLILSAMLSAGCAAFPKPTTQNRDANNAFEVGGGRIEIALSQEPNIGRNAVLRWVHASAEAVTGYYGQFPVRHLRVDIEVSGPGGVRGGREIGGWQIRVELGNDTTEADLRADWVLNHEMFHLAFPDLGDRYLWMNEGLSDYLEPIARARVGQLSGDDVWLEWVEGFPKGQPHRGDRGLDNTHTWARTYWGGNIFWLLADVRIREKTHGSRSLDDALKAVVAAGGDGSAHWEVARVIAVADEATGTTVIKDLHDEMGTKPERVDLDALWTQLGVRRGREGVSFDDTAPLARVRKLLTAPTR